MLRVEGLAKRQLLGVPDSQVLAEHDAGVECPHREIHVAVDEPQVGQLDAECLVHRGEVDEGVGRDVVLVQRPPRLVQPDVLLGPPHRVVRPVHGNVWKKRGRGDITLDYLVSLELIRLTLMSARKGPARDHVRTNGRLMISLGRNYAVVRVITRRALTRSE